jgi:hypothetical protein
MRELLLVPNETPPRLTCHPETGLQGLPVSGTQARLPYAHSYQHKSGTATEHALLISFQVRRNFHGFRYQRQQLWYTRWRRGPIRTFTCLWEHAVGLLWGGSFVLFRRWLPLATSLLKTGNI